MECPTLKFIHLMNKKMKFTIGLNLTSVRVAMAFWRYTRRKLTSKFLFCGTITLAVVGVFVLSRGYDDDHDYDNDDYDDEDDDNDDVDDDNDDNDDDEEDDDNDDDEDDDEKDDDNDDLDDYDDDDEDVDEKDDDNNVDDYDYDYSEDNDDTENKRSDGAQSLLESSALRSHSYGFDDVVNGTYHDIEAVREEQMSRVHHLHLQCDASADKMTGLSSEAWAYGRIEISQSSRYLYCPLLKVGSTFFRRVFYTMRERKQLLNPYIVPINQALAAKRTVLEQILPLNSPSTMAFLNSSTSIIFVREPYSRILSGYVDKLFAPNPYFWSQIGKHIISKYRQGAKIKELFCGHDVTFAEFVEYVVQGEQTNDTHRDAHFTPTYDQCKPCQLNYTVIGKMETFQSDVAYTLSQLGHNVSQEKLNQWAKDATHDAILDSTVSPFGWKFTVRKCMSWHEGLKRIWRKLQIRGIISIEEKFPWPPDLSDKAITVRMFTERVKKLNSQADKAKLKKQKLEVLAEAFSTIKHEHLLKLVDIFKPDFQLFQYNLFPDYIFDENTVSQFRNKHNIFNVNNI
ncbi:Carbohydrate sulfotransferase 9 [Bulinus truncatus]|nr:Carbohydrate sulfotransferase 9 [Bulinus truncatus]